MGTRSIQEICAVDLQQAPGVNFPWRPDITAMADDINWAASTFGQKLVTPCMLAAIIERETNFRNILQAGVPPGPGCGVGPCQITAGVDWSDIEHPTFGGLDLLVPRVNMTVAVKFFLVPVLQEFPDAHQAAFDAYNLGVGGVRAELAAGISPDARTTNGNYGGSVMQGWVQYAAILQNVTPDWTTWRAQ